MGCCSATDHEPIEEQVEISLASPHILQTETMVSGNESDENASLKAILMEGTVKQIMSTEKTFQNAGNNVGLRAQIWRIDDELSLKQWPNELYGEFYGEFYAEYCFLILRTFQNEKDDREHHIYLWIGNNTNLEQHQFAIKKSNTLKITLSTNSTVQFREIDGNESRHFLDIFPKAVMYSRSFNIKPSKDEPQLLHVTGYKKHVQVYQVPITINSLNDSDSFVLDAGRKLFQFNGSKSSAWEKRKANAIVDEYQARRSRKAAERVQATYIIDGIEDYGAKLIDEFWSYFGGRPKYIKKEDGIIKTEHLNEFTKALSLYKMENQVQFTQIYVNKVDKWKLRSDGIFVLNCVDGEYIFVWIGRNVIKDNLDEINIGISYLKGMDKLDVLVGGWIRINTLKLLINIIVPLEIVELCFKYCYIKGRASNIPICIVNEGYEITKFWQALNGKFVGGRKVMKYKWKNRY